MKIINRKAFLGLPANTVFSKYEPCCFENLCIKGDTLPYDFTLQSIEDAIDCCGSEDFANKLDDAEKNGISLKMDFDCMARDGMFDENQLFAVWEKSDVVALIERLQKCV